MECLASVTVCAALCAALTIAGCSSSSIGPGDPVLLSPETALGGSAPDVRSSWGFWSTGIDRESLEPDAELSESSRHAGSAAGETDCAFPEDATALRWCSAAMPESPNSPTFGCAVDSRGEPPVAKPVDDPVTDSGQEACRREPGKSEPFDCPIGEVCECHRLFSGKATAGLTAKCGDCTGREPENRGWGQIDVEAINDYLSGIIRHYSDGIIVGLGEYEDAVSLGRYGRRFPVIIISSTGDGNLADMLYYQYYGLSGNRNLRSLYFDGSLYIHSGGSIYDIRANEKIYLDPAFGRPTYTQCNRTVSDITSYELAEIYDSAGYATLGIQLHDFRIFRGMFNALDESLKWRDHEALVQFRVLGFDLNGDNERCLVIDEPHWETRFYRYCSSTDSWLYIMTLPGIGYPEDWSVHIEKPCFCEDESCLEHYLQIAF
jgi:hypothetical protein